MFAIFSILCLFYCVFHSLGSFKYYVALFLSKLNPHPPPCNAKPYTTPKILHNAQKPPSPKYTAKQLGNVYLYSRMQRMNLGKSYINYIHV